MEFNSYSGHTSWSPNFFQIDIFEDEDLERSDDQKSVPLVAVLGQNPFGVDYVRFYGTGINVPNNTLSFKRNPLTFSQMLEKVEMKDQITITWAEDAELSIQAFHQQWFNRFYNRKSDSFVTGKTGKSKSMQFSVYDGYDSPLMVFKIKGMTPLFNGPELKLGWDKDVQTTATISATYKFQDITLYSKKPDLGTLAEPLHIL